MNAETLPGPTWDPLSAAASADTRGARESLKTLFRLAREGRDQTLFEQVRSIAEGTAHADPERDYVLYTLAAALGDFPPGTISPEVLEYLARTRSRVRVPHDENPGMGVPLYNIRAAAAGSLAQWERRQRGPDRPGKTYTDAESFIAALEGASGPDLAAHAREARHSLDAAEREAIVLMAGGMPDAASASVLLAELAPGLLGRPAVDDALFDLLGHRDLGASAALILGQSGDDALLARLADKADGADELAARRASLAIDLFLSGGRP